MGGYNTPCTGNIGKKFIKLCQTLSRVMVAGESLGVQKFATKLELPLLLTLLVALAPDDTVSAGPQILSTAYCILQSAAEVMRPQPVDIRRANIRQILIRIYSFASMQCALLLKNINQAPSLI